MSWIKRKDEVEAVPTHPCEPPLLQTNMVGYDIPDGEIGDLWRCDECGELWRVGDACDDCDRRGVTSGRCAGHGGYHGRCGQWRPATRRQRRKYRLPGGVESGNEET